VNYCCAGCGYWCSLNGLGAAGLGNMGFRRVSKRKYATVLLVLVAQSSVGPGNRLMQDGSKNPDFALKSGLFVNAWANFSASIQLPKDEQAAMQLVGEFYDMYPWLPRSYLLSNPTFISAMRGVLKCTGANNDWVIKSNDHHGGGIQIPSEVESIRRLTLTEKANEEDCGSDSAAALPPFETDRDLIEPSKTVLQEWMQSIEVPLNARGGEVRNFKLMFRVFFILVWPYRHTLSHPANAEVWFWPQALHHLYEGKMSHHDPFYMLGGAELENYLKTHSPTTLKGVPDLLQWEANTLWPSALEALQRNVEWSEELKYVHETEKIGRYQTGGIDFIVTHDWQVRILEISMHILHEPVPSVLPFHEILGNSTAELFMHAAGFKNSLTAQQTKLPREQPWLAKPHSLPPPEWQLLSRWSPEVRGGNPPDGSDDELESGVDDPEGFEVDDPTGPVPHRIVHTEL